MFSLISKFFPGAWWIYAAIAAAAFATGGTAAWQHQGARLDTVRAEFAGFVSTTRVMGEAAKKAAAEQAARDLQSKTRADHENQTAIERLRSDNKRLRERADSSGSAVPAAAAGASRPDLACFDRTELDAAIRRYESGIQGVAEKGSEAVVNLDTAKRWAQDGRH